MKSCMLNINPNRGNKQKKIVKDGILSRVLSPLNNMSDFEWLHGKSNGPDGVEAWCVALSACFINFVMAGLGRMSGILYVAFLDIFVVNRFQASIPFSVRSMARNLFGPVVGIIGQKYGVRATTLIGGIIGTLSAMFCFYAPSMIWITILWGVLNGAGAALAMTIPQVVLNQHFKKYRTTASGMAFSGGCVGSFLFPVLLEYMTKTYGLGGSFLILSGIIMNTIPAALLLRKPSWLKEESKRSIRASNKISEDQKFQNTLNQKGNECFNERLGGLKKYKDYLCHKTDYSSCDNSDLLQVDTKFIRENCGLFIKLLKNINLCEDNDKDDDNILLTVPENVLQKYFEDLCTLIESVINDSYASNGTVIKESSKYSITGSKSAFSQTDCENTKCEVVLSAATLKTYLNSEFYNTLSIQLIKYIKNDIKIFSSVFSEEECTKLTILIQQIRYIFSELNVNENYSSFTTNHNEYKVSGEKNVDKHPNTFKAHIKTAIRLHKNPLFLLISFSRCVHFLTFVPAMTIIVDFSMDKGLLETDGKYVIAAISFGDLMGRLCLGWITDKEYLSLPRYMFLVMVMQGLCTATLCLMISKPALLSAIAVFGLLQGSLFVRHPVLVSKYLDSHEQSVAMGCFNFFSGLLGFALPNYIGYFLDTIGSYDYIFYINGGIGTIVGILWFFEPYFLTWTTSSQELIPGSL